MKDIPMALLFNLLAVAQFRKNRLQSELRGESQHSPRFSLEIAANFVFLQKENVFNYLHFGQCATDFSVNCYVGVDGNFDD